jgi:hypothetical protein
MIRALAILYRFLVSATRRISKSDEHSKTVARQEIRFGYLKVANSPYEAAHIAITVKLSTKQYCTEPNPGPMSISSIFPPPTS